MTKIRNVFGIGAIVLAACSGPETVETHIGGFDIQTTYTQEGAFTQGSRLERQGGEPYAIQSYTAHFNPAGTMTELTMSWERVGNLPDDSLPAHLRETKKCVYGGNPLRFIRAESTENCNWWTINNGRMLTSWREATDNLRDN